MRLVSQILLPLALNAILAMATQLATAQDAPQAEVGVTFDEAGTCPEIPDLIVAPQLDVYFVAYGIEEIEGYEFQLSLTSTPFFFLGKTLYGAAPADTGIEYEVVARLGECMDDPTAMGASPNSWTLCKFQLLYLQDFYGPEYFCIQAAPSTPSQVPLYTICDAEGSQGWLLPVNLDLNGIAPDGCAVAGSEEICIDTDGCSWSSLKSGFR